MITDDCASHFRLKIKGILIRFVRRLGYDIVACMVPESYQKVLTNIRKLENRRRKIKSMTSGCGGSEENDENADAKSQKSQRSRKGDTFEQVLGSDSDANDEDDNDDGEKRTEQERGKKVCHLIT